MEMEGEMHSIIRARTGLPVRVFDPVVVLPQPALLHCESKRRGEDEEEEKAE